MSNRQDLPPMSLFSSKARTSQMDKVLGKHVTRRLICLALYLLGAGLKELAAFVDSPIDTVKALVKRTLLDGLPALEDRRRSTSAFLPPAPARTSFDCELRTGDDTIWIAIDGVERIELQRSNTLQCKTVLLTLLNAKMLGIKTVAQALGLSTERVRKLAKALLDKDVDAVTDKRSGQQKQYRFTPEVKSELILQFTLNAISGWSTSGQAISKDLQERCEIVVSPRSVRQQLCELGLSHIADTLPQLLEEQKKTSPKS